MIPKTINYCWFGKKRLPKSVKANIRSWEKYCPDYKIIRWDETNFNIETNSFISKAYKEKEWAFVSDFARLKIIYENGGIYLDTDVEIIKNLDALLNNPAYVGLQQQGNFCNTGLGFGAEKFNIAIKEMLKQYDNLTFSEQNKRELACPFLNDKVIRELGYNNSNKVYHLKYISIYPANYFDPIAPGNSKKLLGSSTYTIHHYDASWTTKPERLKRKIINFLGQEKVNHLKDIFNVKKC